MIFVRGDRSPGVRSYRVFKSPCPDPFSEVWLPVSPKILVSCVPPKHAYIQQFLSVLRISDPLMQAPPRQFPIFLHIVTGQAGLV